MKSPPNGSRHDAHATRLHRHRDEALLDVALASRCGSRPRTRARPPSASGIELPGVRRRSCRVDSWMHDAVGAARPRGRGPRAAPRSRRPPPRRRRGLRTRSRRRPPRRRRRRSTPCRRAIGQCSGFFMSSVTGHAHGSGAAQSSTQVGAGEAPRRRPASRGAPVVSIERMRAWASGLRTMSQVQRAGHGEIVDEARLAGEQRRRPPCGACGVTRRRRSLGGPPLDRVPAAASTALTMLW